MACHQINLPPMTSTSTRNILPGNQITQTCFTAGEKTEINIIFILRRLLKTGQEHQNEQENRHKYGRIVREARKRRVLATPGYQLRPGLSDLRGRGIRKARVVIVSAALRRNREGTSGGEGISCFNGRRTMWPLLDSFCTDTRRVIITCLFIPFKKGEKQHLKSQSGFSVNDYFSKP